MVLGKFVMYLTCVVVIGTTPEGSIKKCLSSRRSVDKSCNFSCQIIPTLDMNWQKMLKATLTTGRNLTVNQYPSKSRNCGVCYVPSIKKLHKTFMKIVLIAFSSNRPYQIRIHTKTFHTLSHYKNKKTKKQMSQKMQQIRIYMMWLGNK